MNAHAWTGMNLLKLGARLLLSAVVLFWVWFLLMDGTGHIMNNEQPVETMKWMAVFGVPLLAIGVSAWKWPRVGGVLALLGGVTVAVWFGRAGFERASAALMMMALPLVIGGAALLAATWRGNGARARQ